MAYPCILTYTATPPTASRLGHRSISTCALPPAPTVISPATKRIRKISTSSRATPVPSRSQRSATRRGQ